MAGSVSDRIFSLMAPRDSVNHAKELLNNMCNDHNTSTGVETVSCILVPPPGPSGFPSYQEIMVPGSKVGLVIGKGGETIKMLQEKTGAKMVIIQEGPGQELVVGCASRRSIRSKFELISESRKSRSGYRETRRRWSTRSSSCSI